MQQSIGRLVSILYRKNQIYLNMALKKYDITAAEVPILTYLFKKDGVSQEELSVHMVIDKAATARTIQSLIAKGYVHKEKDQTDRRANRVSLTNRALGIKEEIMKVLLYWTDFLTNGLDSDDVTVMFSVLENMAQKAEQANFSEIGGLC